MYPLCKEKTRQRVKLFNQTFMSARKQDFFSIWAEEGITLLEGRMGHRYHKNILSFTYNAYGFTITGQRSRKSQERFGSSQ